jgi:DNA-binding GntR family transcriptional regulator
MDVFQPVIWHFAAVRRTNTDVDHLKECLEAFRNAIGHEYAAAIVQTNYEIHAAKASACHNRSLEKAARQMLIDKLRVGQHALRDLERHRGHILATRFTGSLRILREAVEAIIKGDAENAENLARRSNANVRRQITEILSTTLAPEIKIPPTLKR